VVAIDVLHPELERVVVAIVLIALETRLFVTQEPFDLFDDDAVRMVCLVG